MTNKTKGIILVFASAVMFGSYGIWSKLIGADHGVFYPGWTRSLLITLALLPFLLYRKEIVPIKRADWKWMWVFLIVTSMTQAPLFYAFNHMDVGTATLLFFVTMLMTMYAVGFLFLGEKINKVKIFSFILAAIGLYVTFSFSIAAFSLFAGLMAIVNGIASGGEVSFSKKLTGTYSSLYLIWLSWVVIAVTNAVISLAAGEVQYPVVFDIFWMYQAIYAVAGVLGFWLVIEGFKYVEASIGGLLGLLEILFSLLFGFLVFHQGIGPRVVLGAVLILCAAALPHVTELLNKKKKFLTSNIDSTKQKHVVIFSHGFGQKKDARGLFTDIASTLEKEGIESILFDYNVIDKVNNTVSVPSLYQQADMLNKVIKETFESNPGVIIDVIGCSQGPLVVGLAKPAGIRKAVFIGASLKPDADSMVKRFGAREGSVVDMEGISKFVRRDNSLTLIPTEYWQSIKNLDGIALYNSLSEYVDVTIIRANQDEVLTSTDITGISPRIHIVNLDGNHDFTNEARPGLLVAISGIISKS